MKGEILDKVKAFNALTEEDKKLIVRKLVEERESKKFVIEELSNTEILRLPQFQEFCSEKKIQPSKRQASKHREEFEAWYKEKCNG